MMGTKWRRPLPYNMAAPPGYPRMHRANGKPIKSAGHAPFPTFPAQPRTLRPPPGAVAMHGRRKSGIPDAAAQRKREEKLRHFRSKMAALLEKASRDALDPEVLKLSQEVLEKNPDVGTAWNLRRRQLGALGGDWVDSELSLVGGCLGVNPKSYGAWHHRGWVLGHRPSPHPDPLCDRLLATDPRNFHAWEHRRALGGDPEAELEFTGRLLSQNFSNFSAWHHRGRVLRPPLDPPVLTRELELIQSAVFTDPTDQSPWIYLRCLLYRAPPPPRPLCVYIDLDPPSVAVTFSRPVRVTQDLALSLDGSPLDVSWSSAQGRPRPGHTWLSALPADLAPPTSPLHFRVTWRGDHAHPIDVTVQPGQTEAWWQEPISAEDLFWPEVGGVSPEVLQGLLGMCRTLLELEPSSRGCLLTQLLLLSRDPLSHRPQLLRCLRDLQEADPLRAGFVSDMAARARVVLGVLEMGEGQELSIPRQGLTSLPLLERLALLRVLELSGNRLRGVPGALGALRRLRVLDLSLNDVTDLGAFPPLPHLRELRLHGNPLSPASGVSSLAACPRLERLRLDATPLAQDPEAAAHVTRLLPRADVILA